MTKKKPLTELKDADLMKRLFPKEVIAHVRSLANPKIRKKPK